MRYISPEFIQVSGDMPEATSTQKLIGIAVVTGMYLGAGVVMTVSRLQNRRFNRETDQEEVNLQFIAQQEAMRYDDEQYKALEHLLNRLRPEEQ